MNPPQPQPDMPAPDDNSTFVIELAEDTDVTRHPLDPLRRGEYEHLRQRQRERLLDGRCSIKPETLKKMRMAAERLGMSEGDLLSEGFALLLQKHRDKLGDLLDPESPNGDAKPENGSPSP